jgi:hypothetical protein
MSAGLRIDHVIMAVTDLDSAGNRLLADFGLASVTGGRHVGHGTANRIVPLGPDYLELIAVIHPGEAASSPFGKVVADAAAGGDRLMGWVLATDQLEEVAARLGLTPTTITRARPDGIELRWRVAGVEAAMADPSLPFFLVFELDPELHPGRAHADHRVHPAGIAWLEVGADPERLTRWLGPHDLPLRVVEGSPGPRALGIATSDGDLVIR